MTAPEPTGITDRTVELWTAGQQPKDNSMADDMPSKMHKAFGTKAQQTALRNIVAMLTIADSGVNDARRIARYIDSMNNDDELKMALSIAIGMLHSAIEDRAAMGGHSVADYLRIAGVTAAHEGR